MSDNKKLNNEDVEEAPRMILEVDGHRYDVSAANVFSQLSDEKKSELFSYIFPDPIPEGSEAFLKKQANVNSFDPEIHNTLFGTLTDNWVGLEDMLLGPSGSNLASYLITFIEQENLSDHALALLKAVFEALDETSSSKYKITVSQRKRGRPYKALSRQKKSMSDWIYSEMVNNYTDQFGKKEAAVQTVMDKAALQRSEVFALLAKNKKAHSKPPERIRIPYAPYEPLTLDLPYSLCEGDIKLD